MDDLSGIKVLVIDIVTTRDGDDVLLRPRERICPWVLWDTWAVESEDELSTFGKVGEGRRW